MSKQTELSACDRVHIFTFVKNEALLMRDWIPYHASLVGFENLHIIDHCSTDDSDSLYAKYKSRGLSVVKTTVPFRQKTQVLSDFMRKYKNCADFLIPLDGDEFLCVQTTLPTNNVVSKLPNNQEEKDEQQKTADKVVTQQPKNHSKEQVNLVASRTAVIEALSNLPNDGKKLMLNQFMMVNDRKDYTDPLLQARRFVFTHAKEVETAYKKTIVQPNSGKAFYPASTFLFTDQGNHYGCVENESKNSGFHKTSLCTAHFCVYGMTHFAKKLEKGIAAYQLDSKKKGYRGVGHHWFDWMQQVRESDIETVFCKHWVWPNRGEVQPALAIRIEQVRREFSIA